MKLILACVLLLLPLSANSGTDIILHVGSKHSIDNYYEESSMNQVPFNEKNVGIGVSYDINPYAQARVGFYDNSYYKTSVYVATSVHTNIDKLFSIGAQVGIISGYEDTPVDTGKAALMFMALPFIRMTVRNVAVEVGYFPDAGSGVSLTTLSFVVKL